MQMDSCQVKFTSDLSQANNNNANQSKESNAILIWPKQGIVGLHYSLMK